MLTIADEYFVRIVLLLLRGARFASKKKIITEVNKVHGDLDNILNTYKTHLKHIFLNKYYEKLFPSFGKTDIETWDLAMLTKVLLKVFVITLTDDEKEAVETIKSIRDEMYAHSHSSTLSSDEYNEYRQKLVDAMKILCSQFDQDDKDECDKIITACQKDEIGESLKLNLQRQLLATESLVQEVLDKLNKAENQICNHITEQAKSTQDALRQILIEELRNFHTTEERSLKKVSVIDSELTLSAPINEGEQVNLAEEIITTVINQAINEVGDANDYPKIRLAVKKILSDIKTMSHVQVGSAEHKCIILRFRCTSYKAVLDLLSYIESKTFKTCLDELANAISADIFDNVFDCKLHVAVATECMTTILHELRAETSGDSSQHKRTIKLPIELKTVKGLEHIWNIFEGECALEHFNELSDAISEHLNSRITVTPSLNIRQVADALKISDEQSSRSTKESEEVIEDDTVCSPQSKSIEIDTNEIYRHLMEVKIGSFKQSPDSGFCSDAVSSIAGQSNTSEEYGESTGGRFEPVIGTNIDFATKTDVISATVGPVVMLNGYDRCFITTGQDPIDIGHFKVNGHTEALTVLAHNSKDSTILIGPVQRDPDLFIEPQVEEVNDDTALYMFNKNDMLSRLGRVFKLGATTGLTQGFIQGIGRVILQGKSHTCDPEEVLFVNTFPDNNFAENGDSGALVIHQDVHGSWSCVGVLIGALSNKTYIVKPIKDILENFKSITGMPVVIDKAYMDRYVSEIREILEKKTGLSVK